MSPSDVGRPRPETGRKLARAAASEDGLPATLPSLFGELPRKSWVSVGSFRQFARQNHQLSAAELPRLQKGLSETRNSQGVTSAQR